MTPLNVMLLAFVIAAIGGLAALLHSGQPITVRQFAATTAYSGMMGFAVAALMVTQYGKEPWGLFGLVAILGMSGVKAIDLVLFAWRRLGITITAAGQKDDDKP